MAEPDPAAPGSYTIEDASLSIAGDWELRIEALIGEFDLLTETDHRTHPRGLIEVLRKCSFASP